MPDEPKKVRGVYENPKGSEIWWIQYFEHGRRRRERVGRKSDAIKLYQKRKTQILQGDKLPELQRKRVSFGELHDDVLTYAREHGRVLRNYQSKADLLRPAFAPRAAEEIKPEEFSRWIARRDTGPASFNRYRSFLSLCYREGIRHGKVGTNPARNLTLRSESRGRKRFLSREEYDRVLAAIRAMPFQATRGQALERAELRRRLRAAAFIVSVHTGMRLSEQFGLRWKQVDFKNREIHLRDTKNGEDRTVPMASVVVDELNALRPAKPTPGGLVFPRLRGGGSAVALRWFGKVLAQEDVAISDYTWHNNRHTFCSWLAIAGCSLRTIQDLAGHKDIAMSARYAHLSPDHKRAEIERLVIGGGPRIVPKPAELPENVTVLQTPSATRTAIGLND